MAIFNRKEKNKKQKEEAQKEGGVAVLKKAPAEKTQARKKEKGAPVGKYILSPRITERTTDLSGHGVYVFNVGKDANKALVKKEIESLYKVTPLAVNIVNLPKKLINFRGIPGRRAGGKKAFVYLTEADRGKISIS